MSTEEALCILIHGWHEETEPPYREAQKVVWLVCLKARLEFRIAADTKKLAELLEKPND